MCFSAPTIEQPEVEEPVYMNNPYLDEVGGDLGFLRSQRGGVASSGLQAAGADGLGFGGRTSANLSSAADVRDVPGQLGFGSKGGKARGGRSASLSTSGGSGSDPRDPATRGLPDDFREWLRTGEGGQPIYTWVDGEPRRARGINLSGE